MFYTVVVLPVLIQSEGMKYYHTITVMINYLYNVCVYIMSVN